jgi:hypothetical protein
MNGLSVGVPSAHEELHFINEGCNVCQHTDMISTHL